MCVCSLLICTSLFLFGVDQLFRSIHAIGAVSIVWSHETMAYSTCEHLQWLFSGLLQSVIAIDIR